MTAIGAILIKVSCALCRSLISTLNTVEPTEPEHGYAEQEMNRKLRLLRLSQAQARSSNTDLQGRKDPDRAIHHGFEVPRAVGYSPNSQNTNLLVDALS